MRSTTLSLAFIGFGLAAAPAMAQMYGSQVQSAPLPGSPVYAAPSPPVGYAAPVTPAPGVGPAFGTVPSPTVSAAPAYAPTVPPTGASAIVHNAPGVGEALRVSPAPVPVAPGHAAPVAAVPPMMPAPLAAAPNPALPMQGEILNGGDRTSAVADAVAPPSSPVALLGQAEQAARQGRLPLASELVERAESLLLTRSTIAGTETVPIRDGAVARMAQARVALGRRDVNTATALMAEAAGMTRGMGM